MAALGLVFLWSLFSHVPEIRGWRGEEALLVWGLAEASSGLAKTCFHGLWAQNQRYVMTGELDRLMLRPVDPLLSLLAEQVMPSHLVLVLLGGGMVAVAAQGLPPISAGVWLALVLAVIAGAALQGAMMVTLAAVGLRVPHRGRTVGLASQAAAFARYPLELFPNWLAFVLISVVPMGLVAAVPGGAALGHRAAVWLLIAPVVGLSALFMSAVLWRIALRGYSGTGS